MMDCISSVSSLAEEPPKLSARAVWLAWGAYSLLHAAVFLHFGPQFIDDAYITFRYAERIAAGAGFSFNDGEAVLGTSAPLWAMLVAAGRAAGVPLAFWVGALSSIFAGWMCVSLWRISRLAGAGAAGLLAGPALLVSERWLFVFLMGMETPFFCAILAAIFAAAAEKRWRWMGLLAAMAAICRFEGAVAGAIGLAAAWSADRKTGTRQTALAALAFAPWFVFAWLYFGSPIPHSVAAKQTIHSAPFFDALAAPWKALGSGVFGAMALLLGAVGAVGQAREWRRSWPVPAWIAAYSLGLGTSGVNAGLFLWYEPPLLIGIWVLAISGLGALRREAARQLEKAGKAPFGLAPKHLSALLAAGLLAAIAAQSSGFWRRHWRRFPPEFTAKEHLYLAEAQALASQVEPGQTVFVGEVGAVAYALPHARILDSSGINSPQVLKLRRAEGAEPPAGERADRPPRWVLDVLRLERPEWIVTLAQFAGGDALRDDPRWAAEYRLERSARLGRHELLIFRRD